jgi:hypothetical protein
VAVRITEQYSRFGRGAAEVSQRAKEPPMGVVLAVLSMVLAGVGSIFFKESTLRMGATRTTVL